MPLTGFTPGKENAQPLTRSAMKRLLKPIFFWISIACPYPDKMKIA
jgi:hypothetical protein